AAGPTPRTQRLDMILTILLSLLAPSLGQASAPCVLAPCVSAPCAQASCASAADLADQDDPAKTFEKRFDEAGEDVTKLWDLYLWADAYDLKSERRRCLRKIVKVDPLHRPANEALGHIFYDGRWFT